MWTKKGKYVIVNKNDNGNFSEIYLNDEFFGTEIDGYYVIAYNHKIHDERVLKAFKDFGLAKKYFQRLSAKLGVEEI